MSIFKVLLSQIRKEYLEKKEDCRKKKKKIKNIPIVE